MKGRVLLAAVVILACVAPAVAQDKTAEPKKFTVRSYGDNIQVALEEAAKALGLTFEVKLDDETASAPCWYALESSDQATVLSGLRYATGLNLNVNAEAKKLVVEKSNEPAGVYTKGYDVSVISSRYKQYINRYGKRIDIKSAATDRDKTPAERLAEFLDASVSGKVMAIGQRLLVTGERSDHARIRAWLKLIGSEEDSLSDAARGHKLCQASLTSPVDVEAYNERPLGSVVASICRLAKVSFAVSASLADEFSGQHLSSDKRSERLEKLLAEHAEANKFNVGCARFGLEFSPQGQSPYIGQWWMVDCGTLLEKLASEYKAQQTEGGRDGGFDGDIVSKGGIAVVSDALNNNKDGFEVRTFGGRLLIQTTPDGFERAVAILKEMGWEPPHSD